MHPCTLLEKTSKCSFENQTSLTSPPPSQITIKSPSTRHRVSSHTELRWTIEVELFWISSTRLRDQSGWRQAVSETGPEVKLCRGLPLFCGNSYLPFFLHCSLCIVWSSRYSSALCDPYRWLVSVRYTHFHQCLNVESDCTACASVVKEKTLRRLKVVLTVLLHITCNQSRVLFSRNMMV